MSPPTPYEALAAHVKSAAERAGIPWDTYHADFLISQVMDWLGSHACALTEAGVDKISDLINSREF